MNDYAYAAGIGLAFGIYALYRLAFSELALRLREYLLVPDVRNILHNELFSVETKKMALNLFVHSASALPLWWPLAIFLLPFHEKIAASQYRDIHSADELVAIKRIHAKAAIVGAFANPIPLILVLLISVPVVIMLAVFKRAQNSLQMLLDVSLVINNRDGRHRVFLHSHR